MSEHITLMDAIYTSARTRHTADDTSRCETRVIESQTNQEGRSNKHNKVYTFSHIQLLIIVRLDTFFCYLYRNVNGVKARAV